MNRQFKTCLLCASIALIFSGCVSHPVWNDRVHAPAFDPNVELRLEPGEHADVLVIYDEQDPDTLKVERRSFYLFANCDWMKNGGEPDYVSKRLDPSWEKIPIYPGPVKNLSDIHDDMFAIAEAPRHFILYSRDDGGSLTDFRLPEYRDWRIAKKVILFPVVLPIVVLAMGTQSDADQDSFKIPQIPSSHSDSGKTSPAFGVSKPPPKH